MKRKKKINIGSLAINVSFYREKWIPFDPYTSYTRSYNDYFHLEMSDLLSGTLLDVGASGDNEEKYRSIGDFDRYVSLDISESETLDVLGDGRELPVFDESIDTVVLSAVLEHVPIQDVSNLVGETYRVLREGGKAIAYIPFIYPLHLEPYDYYRLTVYGLESIFSEKGFSVDVYAGGGLPELILHSLFLPFSSIVDKLGVKAFRRLFVLPHVVMNGIAKLFGKAVDAKNVNSLFNEWYIGQFLVAEKT